ncbi:MAG: hypothetical protein QOJ81_2140 [Chloroflexota bacterium]|jgi:hypothetical protein|nr:hypothetical protein [Chloroflexota bacterium]
MFDSIGRSWELAKGSFRVLRSDKELLIFPFLSFIALVIVTLSFAYPFVLVGGVTSAQNGETNIASYVLAFIFYVVSYTVTFFFQTALVGAAMIRLDGGDPTVRDGLRIAISRLPQIIGYAIIAATVGMILRWISERAGIVGQIIGGVLGFAWSVATFLVVPVLVVEKVGPIEAVKRSGGLLRKTWGEQLIGNVGIGLVFGVLMMLVIFLGGALLYFLFQASFALALAGLVALILVVGVLALIGSALGGIFTASVYRYATKGDAGAMFNNQVVATAFRQKR